MRALAKPTALVLLLVLDGSALAAGNLFCCIDTNGKQVCGDLLPQACYGKAYREIGESGRTLRFVEAPLTAEQRAQRAIEEEKRKVEEEKRKEQRRKDARAYQRKTVRRDGKRGHHAEAQPGRQTRGTEQGRKERIF